MVMGDEPAGRTTEMPLSERNEAVEAFPFDGTDEPLGMGTSQADPSHSIAVSASLAMETA